MAKYVLNILGYVWKIMQIFISWLTPLSCLGSCLPKRNGSIVDTGWHREPAEPSRYLAPLAPLGGQGRVQSSPLRWETEEHDCPVVSNTEYLGPIPGLLTVFSLEKKSNFSTK